MRPHNSFNVYMHHATICLSHPTDINILLVGSSGTVNTFEGKCKHKVLAPLVPQFFPLILCQPLPRNWSASPEWLSCNQDFLNTYDVLDINSKMFICKFHTHPTTDSAHICKT